MRQDKPTEVTKQESPDIHIDSRGLVSREVFAGVEIPESLVASMEAYQNLADAGGALLDAIEALAERNSELVSCSFWQAYSSAGDTPVFAEIIKQFYFIVRNYIVDIKLETAVRSIIHHDLTKHTIKDAHALGIPLSNMEKYGQVIVGSDPNHPLQNLILNEIQESVVELLNYQNVLLRQAIGIHTTTPDFLQTLPKHVPISHTQHDFPQLAPETFAVLRTLLLNAIFHIEQNPDLEQSVELQTRYGVSTRELIGIIESTKEFFSECVSSKALELFPSHTLISITNATSTSDFFQLLADLRNYQRDPGSPQVAENGLRLAVYLVKEGTMLPRLPRISAIIVQPCQMKGRDAVEVIVAVPESNLE